MESHGSGQPREEVPRIRDAARACLRADVASPKLRARQCLTRVSCSNVCGLGYLPAVCARHMAVRAAPVVARREVSYPPTCTALLLWRGALQFPEHRQYAADLPAEAGGTLVRCGTAGMIVLSAVQW